MDRRDFLKVLGVSTAVATPLGCGENAFVADASGTVQWDKAPCRYCGTGCGVEVGVKDGRIVAVRGDEACLGRSGKTLGSTPPTTKTPVGGEIGGRSILPVR